ncbi:Transcription regulator HTH, GntR [Moorella glycerini]|uniref:HTH-type transcriptional regulator YdfH n=1 Tax=Neomoorella stamsii TaxID=1266720 RepID=A0A9X7J4D0_9FIRM|nr:MULTISPECIES: GntR family transcriptional regulator [Moorella]PRR73459.1 putative HTH-type transcriptional regulator YdfH [Moorella stamsii]CEP69228.1 Transcription regulator HTH, GntR [Moorella glycerini]
MSEIQVQLESQKRPLRYTVYHYLKECILDGCYQKGDRLTEAEIAKELKISRTPVREALRKLEQEGLVSYELGKGIVVIYLGAKDMLEIYSIMVALEGMAARLAAENISSNELEKMEMMLDEMQAAIDNNNLAKYQKAHREFNETLFASTKNKHLLGLLKRYQDYIVRTESITWHKKRDRLMQEHSAILNAIKDRDKEKAETLMRKHVEHSRQVYLAGINDDEA